MVAEKARPQREDGQDAASAPEADTLKLTTIGRATGRPHTVVVRFVFHDGSYFVIGGGGKSDWLTNSLARKSGEVLMGHRAQAVACERFFDVRLVKELFAKKYGPATIREWYSDPKTRAVRLTPTT